MAPAHGFLRGIVARRRARAHLRDRSPNPDGAPSGVPTVVERGRGRSRRGSATEAPGSTGRSSRPRARAPGSETPGRNGRSASERGGASRPRSRADSTAQAALDSQRARFRAATARRGFDPVDREARASRPAALEPGDARSTPRSARAPATNRGPRRGASSASVGGRPPDPGWSRPRGPSRMRPPATRSASSARRRSEPPALTSHGVDLDDGTAGHPRATQRTGTSDRLFQPGNRMETGRSRPRPQRRSSGSSAGVTTEASTAPAHSRERRRRDPDRSERRPSRVDEPMEPARAPSSPSRLIGGVGKRVNESPSGVCGQPRISADHGSEARGETDQGRRKPTQ